MTNVVISVIVIGCFVAAVVKAWVDERRPSVSLPPNPEQITNTGAPGFDVIFVTVLKVFAAVALILFIAALALLLIDQHVVSLTG